MKTSRLRSRTQNDREKKTKRESRGVRMARDKKDKRASAVEVVVMRLGRRK
jgi:hypothetical protein